ncbi:hypothetical protein [Paenibacillus hexagrammi]|uniref:Uncharacterized protein n=1 Tax=Paenibacillus hexagrammi TaxID=2908839 RepID=A0ABY3SH60_9BACL|nr:hypothetical protein [Paenibacillus sp. YPD9-1]UJF32541.1 hypothetical protein L0M14_23250 [Paenibacillus sp. YPD9-1]
MYKLLLFILLTVVCMTMYALQADEEISMHTLFQGKHALNNAVHAAAQQSDLNKLSKGIPSIDQSLAQQTALQYLQANLRLNEQNEPLPDTFLRSQVEIVLFKVINDQYFFPYTYINADYNYSVTFRKPGVIMFIKLQYPRVYSVLQPITWTIKASAEMVY